VFDEQGDGLGVRKEYDFSEGVRGRARVRSPKQRGAASRMAKSRQSDSIDDELTPSQIRELRRRMADLDDVTRYLLVSQMGPRFALYYNVSDDVYAMNNPRGATLFKRLKAALAVKALLGGSIRILRCKSRRVNGVRVYWGLRDLVRRWNSVRGRTSVYSRRPARSAEFEHVGAAPATAERRR